MSTRLERYLGFPNEFRLVKRVSKHQSGTHDQLSHGNWADGAAPRGPVLTETQWKNTFFDYCEQNNILQTQAGLKEHVAKTISKRMKVTTEEIIKSFENTGQLVDERRAYPFDKVALNMRAAIDPNVARFGQKGTHVGLTPEGNLIFIDLKDDGSVPAPWNDTERPFVERGSTQAEQYAREYGTSQLVHTWAVTSNNEHVVSLAIQQAARAEFNIKNEAPWSVSEQNKQPLADLSRNNEKVYRAFLRAQYEESQDVLEKMGVKELVLYRGKTVPESSALADAVLQGEKVTTVMQRPLTSWSTSEGTAEGFGYLPVLPSNSGKNESTTRVLFGAMGVTLRSRVPVARILSFSLTGNGSYAENEVVILGGQIKTNARPKDFSFSATEPVVIDDNKTDYKP